MTIKFTLEDTARFQRHVRTAMNNGQLNISQTFEIMHSVFARAPKPTWGHHVNDKNELVPIPGAITDYVDGKPVIACPLVVTKEPPKPLRAVSIDSLCDADGDIDLAESHEIVEVGVRRDRQIVAGEDVNDHPETGAIEWAADASLSSEENENDNDDSE